MADARSIDVHTHVLTEETIRMLQQEAPTIALKLTPIDNQSAVLDVAGTPYRPFPRGAWDVEHRLRDMDSAEVDMQMLSATPQTYLYGQDPSLAASCAALQNEQIAKLVASYPDRFAGIATLPMQAPEKAADELRRSVRTLGLRGTMIGSNIEGKNLDDPSFEPVWAAAQELDVPILIHPTAVAGAQRLRSYYLTNLIGNPLDTTIAAACLVFGGVMERYPNLKIVLVHGGGFVPYQQGRFVHGWNVRPEPQVHLKHSPERYLDRFIYDTILHSKPALEFLIQQAGASRVLLGSDYPYDMGMLDCVRHVLSLTIPATDRATILSRQASALFGVKRGFGARR
jgi:aminocarboxymuconate-semialdehyde decarboxylase